MAARARGTRLASRCRVLRATTIVLLAAACSPKPTARTVRVAAASDLSRVFEELGPAFASQTGITPVIDLGASGALAEQIAHGTPYALFAAASARYVDDVVAAGRCDGATAQRYARGRLVVWTPDDAAAPRSLGELADARFARIAIADPERAPYGRAAREVLEHAGLWDELHGRVVVAASVEGAMELARSREADAAIIARSLALVGDGGAALPVDASLHAPLDQLLVVCGGGADAESARQLAAYIASPEGREVMTRYGF